MSCSIPNCIACQAQPTLRADWDLTPRSGAELDKRAVRVVSGPQPVALDLQGEEGR